MLIFLETTKVYDLDSNLESLAVCFCITSKLLRRSYQEDTRIESKFDLSNLGLALPNKN